MKQYKEKVADFKDEIKSSGYPDYKSLNREGKLIGTMYLKKKMDYGFHIYYIHEPNSNNPLAGVNGTVSEMYYDLRNQIYWIKRNLKDVKFSVRNVDSMFPKNWNKVQEMFDFLSTEANRGLYSKALSHLGAMGGEKTEMFGRFFHRLITNHSYFELLFKGGVDFNRSTRIVKSKGKSPREILGLSKTQWKMVTKYGCSIRRLQEINDCNADKRAINLLAYMKTLEEEFGLEKISEFERNEFSYLYNEYHNTSSLEIANDYNLPIKKFLRYIYFECDVSQGLRSASAISNYKDYIRMTTEMGYERFDRYPKYLKTAHDIASRNYKVKLNELELEEWKKSLENHKKLEYTYQGFKIFPPEEPSDLVREGNVLGHCVGSYVNKVRKGASTILFLRNRDDIETPLVTIEVRNKRITQAKGKMNNNPSHEQQMVIKKFAEKFELAV
ncbi:PcfJ domain-containing protein [Bacillus sp. SCS-151]|uniref:PcfJ domain-containing protein n=1 Tax=Nanhaiella sioensis TaxID=3115293 RepID=UPI00397810AC